MVDKQILALLNQEVDGTNSANESARVRNILRRDDEARRMFEELQQLSSTLRSVPTVDPPRSLKPRILNTLPRPAAGRPRVPMFWNELLRMPSIRTAFTFAGGAVAGILVFVLFTGTPDDSSGLAGTIGRPEVRVGATDVDLPGLRGTLWTERSNGLLRVNGSLTGDTEFVVRVSFLPAETDFVGFSTERPASASLGLSHGQVQLTARDGIHYTLSFTSLQQAPKMTVHIVYDGDRHLEHTLTFADDSQTAQSH